jgi:ABC-type bacteriocin/lantibiotic exporter with double-glycine peptidase domain
MKTITKIAIEGIRTKFILVFFMLFMVTAGFLLIYANDLLAVSLNDYIMVLRFDGFALQILFTTGMFILVFGMNAVAAVLRADFEYGTIIRFPRYYISRLLRAKQNYFTNRPVPELYSNLWTASQASGKFYGDVLTMISRIIVFVFYGIVVFRFDAFAGIFTVVALPIYFLLTAGLGSRISTLQHGWVAYNAELATVTQEAFENVANVKAKGAYAFFLGRSVAVLNKIKRLCVKLIAIESYIGGISGVIRLIAPLLIIFAAVRLSPSFEPEAGNIIVFYINIPLFLNGVADIHRQYINFKMAWPFLAKLAEFNDCKPEHENGAEITDFDSLRTVGVRVRFDSGRVIHVPDFIVEKGEKVMLFGESGIGKSTVFNMIIGFQDYEGDIFVNDINLREISLASIRRVFGITFQHTNAITLDLHGNILLGAEKSDNELERLIKLTALENQQNTKGKDILNNKVLSGGEKSRLGLSQMLVTEPMVMLIDEAFSSMDEGLELKIINDLFFQYPDHTVICISHRNSSKPLFDRIVDFNGGLT